MPSRTLSALVIATLVSGLTSSPMARAQDGSADADTLRPLDRFSVWVGRFQARSDTRLAARFDDGTWQADGSFGLEDDLGMDREATIGHGRFDMLFGDAQGLSLEYFGYERGNEHRLTRRIEWDGDVYDVDASVEGEIDYQFASAAWRWWAGKGPTVFGVGLGVAHYRVETFLAGEATLNGDTVAAQTRTSDAAIAPLATLGWRHAFSERWRAYADLSGVARDSGDLQGHIVDGAVGVEWFPGKRWGLALEYGMTRIRLDRIRDPMTLRLDLELSGPSLFLRLR